jgi:hypothetical protein
MNAVPFKSNHDGGMGTYLRWVFDYNKGEIKEFEAASGRSLGRVLAGREHVTIELSRELAWYFGFKDEELFYRVQQYKLAQKKRMLENA